MSELQGGVIVINKPYGITSHDVVGKIRKLYGTRKVGHTGTLDPMATGVLPVLVGNAVKASEYLVLDDKEYLAKMVLGIESDTEDISGTVIKESDFLPSDSEVECAVSSFLGKYMQVPPMYSALKVNGQKLYELARQGKDIAREAREVEVISISAKKLGANEWELNARVSKGTYIRTLIADIGRKLGCGAVMSALERRSSGGFAIDCAFTLDEIEDMTPEERFKALTPTEKLFSSLSEVTFSPFYERLCKNGAEIYLSRAGLSFSLVCGDRVRIKDQNGVFYALGEVREFATGLAIKPIKFFN